LFSFGSSNPYLDALGYSAREIISLKSSLAFFNKESITFKSDFANLRIADAIRFFPFSVSLWISVNFSFIKSVFSEIPGELVFPIPHLIFLRQVAQVLYLLIQFHS
jgi:hypothetical protein